MLVWVADALYSAFCILNDVLKDIIEYLLSMESLSYGQLFFSPKAVIFCVLACIVLEYKYNINLPNHLPYNSVQKALCVSNMIS